MKVKMLVSIFLVVFPPLAYAIGYWTGRGRGDVRAYQVGFDQGYYSGVMDAQSGKATEEEAEAKMMRKH